MCFSGNAAQHFEETQSAADKHGDNKASEHWLFVLYSQFEGTFSYISPRDCSYTNKGLPTTC